jgi:S1-C subfamily serine protease
VTVDANVGLVKHLIASVVNIHTEVADSHPSVRILGDDRLGTGTIVEASGVILTVNYVVMGARAIQVSFAKGRSVRAELIAQDFEIGLAVLRVKRQGLAAIGLGDSTQLERGDPVFSLAATGPHERHAAGGLVTYLGEFEAYWEYLLDRGIVSSAANPGFGGGPLCTLGGQMVGVASLNLAEIARTSLAIPVECYRANADEFLRYGRLVSRPKRAWLGLFAHPLEEGVVVAGLIPDGPGERSGLREGDVILSLDSVEVPTRRDLYRSLWRHVPGERIRLEVMRDNETKRLEITGGDRAEFFRQL